MTSIGVMLPKTVHAGSELMVLPKASTALATKGTTAIQAVENAGKETSKLGKYGKIAAIAVAGLAALGLVAKGVADKKQEEAPAVYA